MSTVEKISVMVEQRHIDTGDRHTPYRCPIALSARERGLKTASMHINGSLTLVAMKGYGNCYVSVAAGTWADSFDQGKPVKPQVFVFEKATS